MGRLTLFCIFVMLILLPIFVDGQSATRPTQAQIDNRYEQELTNQGLNVLNDKTETDEKKKEREEKIQNTIGSKKGYNTKDEEGNDVYIKGYEDYIDEFYTDNENGWDFIKGTILSDLGGGNDRKLLIELSDLIDEKGVRLSLEWSFGNDIRKVTTVDMILWGASIKDIHEKGVGGFFGYNDIDDKVNAFITKLKEINEELTDRNIPQIGMDYSQKNEIRKFEKDEFASNNIFSNLDIPRTFSLFLSGGGLFNSFLKKIFQQTLLVPGFKHDSYKIFTDFNKNDPFTIATNFAQNYPKGALINLQPNYEKNYVPQINNYASNLENVQPAILIKPLTNDASDNKNEKKTDVYDAKIILRNLDISEEDVTYIANQKVWSAMVNFAETSVAFDRLDANSWSAFVNLLNNNLYSAGVTLVQTPYSIATTGIPLEENKDYQFTASRIDGDSFVISTTLLNNANPKNSVIIATVIDANNNQVISFDPRTLEEEATYSDDSLYDKFGTGSFTVDIEILTQQEGNGFESLMNKIEQLTFPSRLDDIAYSAMG